MDNTTNMSRDVMNGFSPDMVAVYKTLVSEFAVFDRYISFNLFFIYIYIFLSHLICSNKSFFAFLEFNLQVGKENYAEKKKKKVEIVWIFFCFLVWRDCI